MDLEAAIEQLPHGARTVFVLHDVEGYRHEEIGDMLGVSAGTSKSQLHRARQTLRGLLNKKRSETRGRPVGLPSLSDDERTDDDSAKPITSRSTQDDVLAQAIGQWRDELPARDLWPGVQRGSRLQHQQPPMARHAARQFTFTLPQLAWPPRS